MSNKKFIMLCLLTTCLFIFIAQNLMAGADWQEKQKQMFAQICQLPRVRDLPSLRNHDLFVQGGTAVKQ